MICTMEKTEVDYCPHLNICKEARRDLCYSQGYKICTFYEVNTTIAHVRQKQDEGLAKRIRDKLGNPTDKNWGQV